jgi:hypothetical protein
VSLLLSVSRLYLPGSIRKRQLARLFKITAEAFQTVAPSLKGLSCDDTLKLYALFTREQAGNAIRQGKEVESGDRLFRNAFSLGQQLKADFRIKPADVMPVAALVYRILKIDFDGRPDGSILIKRCFFSSYYSGQVCHLISSLDAGLLAGLAGGGKLIFSGRITEGDACCLAHLEAGSSSNI